MSNTKVQRTESRVQRTYTSKDKWIVAIIFSLLFLLLSAPFTFRLTNKISEGLTGGSISLSNDKGCPTYIGLGVHFVIFLLLLRLLLR